MLAITQAYRDGLLHRSQWLRNLVSGVIVGVVALPLAMAFAIASGARPEQGLFTAIVAGIVVALFGGCRLQIAGPTGAFVVVLSAITAQYGLPGLQIATLMAGLILILFGVARFGVIIKFIPMPVILGFTSGIAVIIWVGQWQYFFGLEVERQEHFHSTLLTLLGALPGLHPPTLLLGLCALATTLFWSRLPVVKRVPGPLAALVGVTLFQWLVGFEGVASIGSEFGGIPRALPTPAFPAIAPGMVIELIGPAFTIAMLGAIESLLSAVVADGMAGTRHDSNQELIGQGLANVASPLFGGFAATGAIARTATNIRNGATSPLSGLFHALTLVLILIALAPLAGHIPLAVLAAILFVVAWNMSEAGHFVRMVRTAPPMDVAILLITFTLTIVTDLVVAVNIGVILAVLNFLRRMAGSVEVREATRQELQEQSPLERAGVVPDGVVVYSVQGPLFFGAAETFERALAASHTDPDTVVIHLKWVPFVDATGLLILEEVIEDLHRRRVRVMIAGANGRVHGKLRRAGILELIGEADYQPDLSSALRACQAEGKED